MINKPSRFLNALREYRSITKQQTCTSGTGPARVCGIALSVPFIPGLDDKSLRFGADLIRLIFNAFFRYCYDILNWMKNRPVLLLLILLAVFFCWTPSAYSESITGSGCSVSNVGYLQELAKEYERQTGVKVLVRGGGTVVGIEDVRTGKVDFAASCRKKSADDPADVDFIQVAWDALAFVVHKSNPLNDISLDEVRAIYAGKITNWKQLNGKDAPIKIFVSKTKKGLSGVEGATRELVLKGKEVIETPQTLFLASTAIVEQMVEDTPGGFATTGFSSARKRDLKMLKVNGVPPDKKNIINNKYPLKRPLFLLVPRGSKPAVKNFVDFTLSNKGQKFISSQGVVSLNDSK
jgi:phosphate transport system substrate-binding protein